MRVIAALAVVLLSGCPAADEQRLCTASLRVRLPQPNPLTAGPIGDVARVVITRSGVELFNDSVQLFDVESGGITVDVVDASGNRPIIPPSDELQIGFAAYSSFARGDIPILASGRTPPFECAPDETREVPLYVGPANRFADAPAADYIRSGATATAVGDGRVLIVGGENAGGAAEPAAVMYDHATGALCSAECLSNVPSARVEHTATAVVDADGVVRAVLIAGGRAPATTTPLAEVVRFDVATATFADVPVSASTLARTRHAAVFVRGNDPGQLDGRVLLIGGCGTTCATGALRADLLAVDPDSGTVETISFPGLTPFYDATATMLPSATTFIAGGRDGNGVALADIRLFAARDQSFTTVDTACPGGGTTHLCAARYGHTATLLDDDNVLLFGGETSPAVPATPTAEVYLLGPNRVVPVTSAATIAPSVGHTATRISCVTPPCPVLMTGGRDPAQSNVAVPSGTFIPTTVLDSVDAYDTTWIPATVAANPRADHAAAALADGTVLTFGGVRPQGDTPHTSAAVFSHCEGEQAELSCPDL